MGGMGFDPSMADQQPQRREATVTVTLEEAFHGATRMLQTEDGKRLEVNIPRGVNTGSKVRMRGAGEGGDIVLTIEVEPHNRFTRDGDNLRVRVPVELYTLVLGGEVQVPTLERPVALTVPAGAQNGKLFRLRGLGMPHLKNPGATGRPAGRDRGAGAHPSECEGKGVVRGVAEFEEIGVGIRQR